TTVPYVPLAQREVIDPGDRRRGGDRRVGQRHDQPQHGGGMDRHAQGAGQPPAAPSATTRAYPAWTREDTAPHNGHRACAARQDARITTASPVSSTCPTRSPRRCGNSMNSSSSPCPETSRTRPATVTAPADGMAD